MKNETEVRTLIEILKFRIERDEKAADECDKQQRECQRIYQDCGTMTHQKQMENQIRELGKMIIIYKKDVKKWKEMLEIEQGFLLHLLKQKE
jgi:hypothetical protein